MTLRPIAGIVLRQIYLLRGSPVRVFPMVTWVAIDIVLWGFITRYLNSVSGSGVNFVPTLLGGVLLWDFCTRIMQGVSTAFLEDVWSRNFLNLFASPLSISEYIAGLVITSVMTSSLGVVVMLVLATGVFHLQFFSLGMPLVAFLMVLFVFGITLGIFASAIVLKLGPASEWLDRAQRTAGALQRRERGIKKCQTSPTCRYNEVVLVTTVENGKVFEGHRGPREI